MKYTFIDYLKERTQDPNWFTYVAIVIIFFIGVGTGSFYYIRSWEFYFWAIIFPLIMTATVMVSSYQRRRKAILGGAIKLNESFPAPSSYRLLAIVFVSLLMVVGIFVFVVYRPTSYISRQPVVSPPRPYSIATITPTAMPYIPSANAVHGRGSKTGWQMYVDGTFRYSIEYPNEWGISYITNYIPTGPYSVRLSHQLNMMAGGEGGGEVGGIVVTETGDPECTKSRDRFLKGEPDWIPITVNGVSGWKSNSASQEFFVRGNRCYAIGFGCPICDQVLSTFKFTN